MTWRGGDGKVVMYKIVTREDELLKTITVVLLGLVIVGL